MISYKYQFIHDYSGRAKRSDIEHYNDKNNLSMSWDKKGRKIENLFFFSNKALPLDKQAQELSELSGIEITPWDIADYIIDRKNNPEKYKLVEDEHRHNVQANVYVHEESFPF